MNASEADVIEESFADLADVFDFEESTLEYYDQPLRGWLRRKSDGARFAFDCRPIVAGLAWHWTLVPAHADDADARVVLERVAGQRLSWVSILEDRRTPESRRCRLVPIDGSVAPAVIALPSERT